MSIAHTLAEQVESPPDDNPFADLPIVHETGPIEPLSMVMVHNLGPEPFVGQYAKTKYTIQPGQSRMVPYLAMCVWFGDPRAVDIDSKRHPRTDEWDRVRTKYGVYHFTPEECVERGVSLPNVTVTNLDQSGRYVTVIDDPEGSHLTPAVQSQTERRQLEDSMTRMQREMEAMRNQLLMMQSASDARAESDATADARREDAMFDPGPSAATTERATPTHSPRDTGNVVTEDAPIPSKPVTPAPPAPPEA